MNIQFITSELFQIRKWSGGTTTELFIWPLTANFEKRDFDFRLSSAKVETEKSDFTPFPDYERHLSILDGEIQILHQNQYEKKLKRLDTDRFSGSWKTQSIGKATDFNLIIKPEFNAQVECLLLTENQEIECSNFENLQFLFIFNYSGELEIESSEKPKLKQFISDFSLVKIHNPIDSKFIVKATKESVISIVKIN